MVISRLIEYQLNMRGIRPAYFLFLIMYGTCHCEATKWPWQSPGFTCPMSFRAPEHVALTKPVRSQSVLQFLDVADMFYEAVEFLGRVGHGRRSKGVGDLLVAQQELKGGRY